MVLVYKRNYALQVQAVELLAEFLRVAAVNPCCSRSKIGKCPNGKHGPGSRPCEHCETHPLQKLAEIICRRYISEHSSARNIVLGVARTAQMPYYVVAIQVYGNAAEEYYYSGNELR